MRQLISTLRNRVLTVGASPHDDGKNIVAFSGGVDSSLVAALVHEVFPGNATACVGVSSALPEAQLHLARRVADHIGIPLSEVATGEGSNPDYIANEGNSCFHCKTHLYSALEAVAERAGEECRGVPGASSGVRGSGEGGKAGLERRQVVLFNGTNKDDKRDPTRVGLKAARDFSVASPIDILTKAEVRAVSRELGLPNWNHAASPCLRSRLAFGVQATPEKLALVEKAEDVARRLLRLGVSHNLRVRAMHGDKALLEVDQGDVLQEALHALPEIRREILLLGFQELDVRAFRSGGVSGAAVAASTVTTSDALGLRSEAGPGGIEVSHVQGTGIPRRPLFRD